MGRIFFYAKGLISGDGKIEKTLVDAYARWKTS